MDENLEGKTPPESFNDSEFQNVERPNPYAQTQDISPLPPRRRSPKKFLFIIAGVILILILLNFVRGIGSKSKSTPSPTPTPAVTLETPTPGPTEEPTPTATPKPSPISSIDKTTGLDRAKLSVSVQNGSGTAGVAGKMADLLKSLGYNVTSTGNADNFNYTNVTIKTKPASKDYLPVLNKDISSNNYSIGATSSDLTATASADALVIVGK